MLLQYYKVFQRRSIDKNKLIFRVHFVQTTTIYSRYLSGGVGEYIFYVEALQLLDSGCSAICFRRRNFNKNNWNLFHFQKTPPTLGVGKIGFGSIQSGFGLFGLDKEQFRSVRVGSLIRVMFGLDRIGFKMGRIEFGSIRVG